MEGRQEQVATIVPDTWAGAILAVLAPAGFPSTMNLIDRIVQFRAEIQAIRRDLHAHPELAYDEHRTSDKVAQLLAGWGIEVNRGLGGTGVVGVLRNGAGRRAIGLRADMDALPILETTGLPYASTVPGKMHACGHDGHTTMLLGAARYLAETRNFAGTAVFVFQPAEEGLCCKHGARPRGVTQLGD